MERTERIESMKWNKGFSARYFITLVDRVTWRDKEVYPILSGKIDRGIEELMESADIELRKFPKDGECWIRVYMEARQEGESPSKVALFTGLISAPERVINGKVESYAAECYSTLKPAADVLMQRGWYAPVGVEGAVLIKKLLSVGNAPVFYEEYSPSLTKPIVAEDGESNLSMAQKIVKAIGWNIHISGEGIIHICPKSVDIKETFDALENDSIEMKVTDTLDWYSCDDLIGRECGVGRHIAIFKKKGIWKEDGRLTPKPGWIIVYNWNDSTQPNDSGASHIGIVEKVSGREITVIEGNKGEAVARRKIPTQWGYIRGYAAPRYDSSSSAKPSKKKPSAKKPAKKSITEIAKEVIRGKWGNGLTRKLKLKKAGYNYDEVQKKVNQMLRK
mgnify:CR=1 FL=1